MQADRTANPEHKLKLRWIVFGGEALELWRLRPWLERYGEERPGLVNMYGITETTVHVTYRRVKGEDTEVHSSRIGWRIPDLQLHVLDPYMNPVPIGAVGELYVGGAGLARGYWNRAGLTAERFLPDPFAKRPGARLYRTGDLGRYLENGDIEYRGRADEQVKIRGFRIELGEIQAALESHTGVKQAVVVADAKASGDQRLVGYYVSEDARLEAEPLRQYLRQRLPEYMVPATLMAVETLPLTVNGKVDLKALPVPEWQQGERRGYVAPRTVKEELLAAVWGQVLEVEEVSVESNFFDIGGDSISSLRVLALAHKQGLQFSLTQLFEHATVAALARVARLEGEVETIVAGPFDLLGQEDRARLPQGIEAAYPMTLLQAGMLFEHERKREQSPYLNLASVHIRARWDREAMQRVLRRLMQQHPVLRTSFDLTTYSEPLQLVHEEVAAPLEVEDWRGKSRAEQEQALVVWEQEQKQKGFEVTEAPLLRVYIHVRSDETFQFGMVEHHAILDGWSVAWLQAELFRQYLAEMQGRERNPGGAVDSVFRQYVVRERQALQSSTDQEYWKTQLRDSQRLQLPRRGGASQLGALSHSVEIGVSEALADGLRRVARQCEVPLKSVLLAVHLRVLAVVSGQSDIVTGLVTHGRPEIEDADRALGLFLNSVPLRVQLADNSWRDLIQQIFQAERAMLPHRYYPLARMMQDQGGDALFETLFNYVHFRVLDEIEESGGVEVLQTRAFAETEFAFAVHCVLQGRSMALVLSLKADQFSENQAQAIAQYYEAGMKALVSDPRRGTDGYVC